MTAQIAPLAGPGKLSAGRHRAPAPALAADAAVLLTEASDEISQLKAALQSNRRIGMAMGLVMGQLGVTDAEAFDALRRISQNTNRKLHDVAEDVILQRRI